MRPDGQIRVLLCDDHAVVRGYLLKDAEASEVVRAIRAAARGEAPLDPRVARAVLARGTTPAPLAGMTAREREVLALLGTGMANKVIARRPGHVRRRVVRARTCAGTTLKGRRRVADHERARTGMLRKRTTGLEPATP